MAGGGRGEGEDPDLQCLVRVYEYGPSMFGWGIKKFFYRLFPFALFWSHLNSLSTTTWHFEWEGVTIHQINMHIQMHFNVQCTLKGLPQILYEPALQCNFSIKTFYHNRITNSNLFISFSPINESSPRPSSTFFPLLMAQWENNY